MSKINNLILEINLDEIKYIEAVRANSMFYFQNDESKLIPLHIGLLEKIFAENNQIIRVHRSYLVNKNLIEFVDNKAGYLKISTDTPVPTSSKYLALLDRVLV